MHNATPDPSPKQQKQGQILLAAATCRAQMPYGTCSHPCAWGGEVAPLPGAPLPPSSSAISWLCGDVGADSNSNSAASLGHGRGVGLGSTESCSLLDDAWDAPNGSCGAAAGGEGQAGGVKAASSRARLHAALAHAGAPPVGTLRARASATPPPLPTPLRHAHRTPVPACPRVRPPLPPPPRAPPHPPARAQAGAWRGAAGGSLRRCSLGRWTPGPRAASPPDRGSVKMMGFV